MTILARIQHWKNQEAISAEQEKLLTNLAREDPFSLALEWNVLMYAGVLAFIAGLGWTVSTWSRQLGDLLVLAGLSALLAACLWFCFTRVPAWSRAETPASSHLLDYVLYLGCLVWCLELTYIEKRFHLLSGQGDLYLLFTATFFFGLAYRFDNRFVLSLALSSLAGWFGLTLSHGPFGQDPPYRQCALLFCLLVGIAAVLLRRVGLKPHFFATYLNLVANVLFWALLSGVFQREGYGVWFAGLLAAGGASLAWGLTQRQFAFVAYAAVYVYIGISYLLIRNLDDPIVISLYCLVSAVAVLALLVKVAQDFGRSE